MNNSNFEIVKNKYYPEQGRCLFCEARRYCNIYTGTVKCKCSMDEYYILNIKTLRKEKLKKLNENRR